MTKPTNLSTLPPPFFSFGLISKKRYCRQGALCVGWLGGWLAGLPTRQQVLCWWNFNGEEFQLFPGWRPRMWVCDEDGWKTLTTLSEVEKGRYTLTPGNSYVRQQSIKPESAGFSGSAYVLNGSQGVAQVDISLYPPHRPSFTPLLFRNHSSVSLNRAKIWRLDSVITQIYPSPTDLLPGQRKSSIFLLNFRQFSK